MCGDINSITRRKLAEKVAQRDGKGCMACETTENLTLDHILARRLGGGNHINNLMILCNKCNSWKGCLPINAWILLLASNKKTLEGSRRIKEKLMNISKTYQGWTHPLNRIIIKPMPWML